MEEGRIARKHFLSRNSQSIIFDDKSGLSTRFENNEQGKKERDSEAGEGVADPAYPQPL